MKALTVAARCDAVVQPRQLPDDHRVGRLDADGEAVALGGGAAHEPTFGAADIEHIARLIVAPALATRPASARRCPSHWRSACRRFRPAGRSCPHLATRKALPIRPSASRQRSPAQHAPDPAAKRAAAPPLGIGLDDLRQFGCHDWFPPKIETHTLRSKRKRLSSPSA